ncbi:protein SMG7-like [Coccinella septempunctata]|uniref:protein SMG7-like n=1 Tax=Coccinella septempunctata TaxID=41139 RepID=UPI001D0997DE|nr:protein SMG7-like [Coccinella septempunctata]
MVYNISAAQILQQAEDLKIKVLGKRDLLNDSQAWLELQKLQTVYQQALILDLEYALDKKVEVDLWNIGFKNHINILQEFVRDKKNPQRSDCQALLTWFLESASGFYISLLQEFCNKYEIDLCFRRQGRIYGQAKELLGNDHFNSPQSTSCLYICQYCLVHLGDIARYRNQRKQAESFYKQAIQVSPNSGHPYNQLALLEASLGDKLSTVFYYVRGIAVKNPFPAATTNLLSTLSSIIDRDRPNELQSRMTANEFINFFICTHGYIYTMTDLFQAQTIVKNLGTIMTALVATQSFTEDKLIKMTVINLYALDHISSSGKNEELTVDEKTAKLLILDLLASFLSAFLVPIHTLQADKNLIDYYALPAVKIIFHWIQDSPLILTESVFMKRLQIWPSFCKLLNSIQPFLEDFSYNDYANVPLREDKNLKGFLPLSNYLKQFDFDRFEDDISISRLIRVKRILNFGLWLTDFEVNGTKLITKTESDNIIRFEPGCIQPDPTNELLEEIKSFSIDNQTQNATKMEKKGGILKPQGSLEKYREERELMTNLENNGSDKITVQMNVKQESAKMKRAKQNVALQSIYKKMEENKQVKFSVEEKDKLVKFEQKSTPASRSPSTITNTNNQFGSSIRTPPFNQNHSVFPPVSNHQQQDYLTSLRNMANNYGMGNNYPMQGMYGGGMRGNMTAPGWGGGQAPQKTNYSPMNMGTATYNHLQSSGFDGNATANWWNGPAANNMMTPGGGGFNNFSNPPPFGGPMMGGPKMGNNNQASGDSFNSPWNYGGNMGQMGGGFEQSGNLTMRQQMLKEANNMTSNMGDKFVPNQHNSSGYSLFNTNSWNPSLTNHLRNPVGISSENAFGSMQQSSLFANQRPQSLAQLLEQQNQMPKNDFH